VEFGKLGIIFRDGAGYPVAQTLIERAAQKIAACFDSLHIAKWTIAVLTHIDLRAPLKMVFLSDCRVAAFSAMLINCLC
jgi:hypothetical protein